MIFGLYNYNNDDDYDDDDDKMYLVRSGFT